MSNVERRGLLLVLGLRDQLTLGVFRGLEQIPAGDRRHDWSCSGNMFTCLLELRSIAYFFPKEVFFAVSALCESRQTKEYTGNMDVDHAAFKAFIREL